MRKKVSGFVTVRAISGTYVVFLAFGMAEADAKGLMGFAIQRTDLTENETIWLRGSETFLRSKCIQKVVTRMSNSGGFSPQKK